MVDPVMGWFKVRQLYWPPMAYRCQQILNTVWWSYYPRPKEIGMDSGSKFKGVFEELCKNIGLTPVKWNTWNPQWNSILEQIHQVLTDGLWVFNLDNADIDPEDNNPFDKYISFICYAICILYHQTLRYLPVQLVFRCNMMVDTVTLVDWEKKKWRKQERICKKRIKNTYQPGNNILIKQPGIVWKLAIPFEGLYKVISHSISRGSITYKKLLTENDTVNVWHVYPYHRGLNKILSNTEWHLSIRLN